MWEDDFEMVRPNPVWDLSEMIKEGDGLMIMDFHPIHIFLNSINLSNYRLVRKQGKLADVSEDLLQQYIQSGHGAGYAFQSAIEYIQKNDSIFLTDYLR
jgi:hypothetical protein